MMRAGALVLVILMALHPHKSTALDPRDNRQTDGSSLFQQKRWSVPLGHQYIGLGRKRDIFHGIIDKHGHITNKNVNKLMEDVISHGIAPTKLPRYITPENESYDVNQRTPRHQYVSPQWYKHGPQKRTLRKYKTFFSIPGNPIVSRRMALRHRNSPVNPILYYLGIGR